MIVIFFAVCMFVGVNFLFWSALLSGSKPDTKRRLVELQRAERIAQYQREHPSVKL